MLSQPGYTLRNYRVICKVVLSGTYVVIAVVSLLLVASLLASFHSQAIILLGVCGLALGFMASAHVLLARGQLRPVAYMLLSFYLLLAAGIVWTWGINTPMGLLLFGLVIVLAAILLTARHALIVAAVAAAVLLGEQTSTSLQWHQPNVAWSTTTSSFSDVLAYCAVFFMLALTSWLYTREMDRSLLQAYRAEAQLRQQKATLKTKVKQRTEQLHQAQLDEMQQMYRFAELGQLGVTLLHDLANHLAALTLEIEGLESKQQADKIVRTRQIIGYLESIVDNTRERLHGKTENQPFDIVQRIGDVVRFLSYKAEKSGAVIDWQPTMKSVHYQGDAACLSQVVAILISNAIDAYSASPPDVERRIVVAMRQTDDQIFITVSDWGKGIAKDKRRHLFKPFHSNKKTGLGLGLFIARRSVEMYFDGTLTFDVRASHTRFILTLPITHDT